MDKLKNIFSRAISSDDTKSSSRKFMNSIWAIVFGLVIASIFILIIGKNPFVAFKTIIKGARSAKEITWIYFGMYAVGAMSIGIAFKAGLFNIGVPGQMMAGGTAAYLVIGTIGNTETSSMILGMIVAILIGMAIAILVGLLKSFLNVHEVVSTIMLNWIILYLTKYIFRPGTKFNDGGHARSSTFKIVSETFNQSQNAWIFSIIIVVVLALTLWFVISKTSMGYKIKSIGVNQNAAKYSGYNDKIIINSTLAISGALAGLSGFMYYIIQKSGSINLTSGQPLSYGFDTIAISLLAYNSLLGIPLSAIFYAVLQSGQFTLELETGIGREFYAIIVGIIIYLAAIAVIFQKFKPINLMLKFSSVMFMTNCFKLIKSELSNYKKLASKQKIIIKDQKEIYSKNKNNLKEKLKKIKLHNKKLRNDILHEKDYGKLQKIYADINKNRLDILSLSDEYGKTEYISSKLHLKSLWRNTLKKISKIVDEYSLKQKKAIKSCFVAKNRKGGK